MKSIVTEFMLDIEEDQKKAAIPTASPKVEQKVVKVEGDQAWTDTGLLLRLEDKVTITATGKVYFSGTSQGAVVDPNGWMGDYENGWPDDYGHCFDPLPSVNHAALIGGFGSDQFFVGKNKTFSGKKGKLYLGINDCSLTGIRGNSGSFQAVIKVEHKAVPPQE